MLQPCRLNDVCLYSTLYFDETLKLYIQGGFWVHFDRFFKFYSTVYQNVLKTTVYTIPQPRWSGSLWNNNLPPQKKWLCKVVKYFRFDISKWFRPYNVWSSTTWKVSGRGKCFNNGIESIKIQLSLSLLLPAMKLSRMALRF